MKRVKSLTAGAVDIVFSISWISFSIPLLGWIFGAEKDWGTVTFGEFFGKKTWFDLWIISIFYIAIRLLLRGKLWRIIFDGEE